MVNKIRKFYEKRSDLELFLLKSGVLYILWLVLKLLFNNIPVLIPVAESVSRVYTQFILLSGELVLRIFGYNPILDGNHLFIDGSRGVTIVKGCQAWFLMSVYAGFIIVYPGNRKSKYWFIIIGLIILVFLNILRISGMVLVSYYAQEKMRLYHKYIFKTILHLSVFIMWLLWVSKHGKKLIKT
ncbi:MAG: archaeosortase/exosortase family protein [Bacteroidales bacterium]|nr:archaeosortase/exosortase family protein [Bacteroidales bacterium]